MKATYPLLIVDDDPEERYLMQLALNDIGWGHSAQSFNSAEALLHYLALLPAAQYPSLLLLDFHMPGLNGLQLLELLKESQSFRYLPVVVYTSHLQAEIKAMLLKAGAERCCNKVQDYRSALSFAEWLRQTCNTSLQEQS